MCEFIKSLQPQRKDDNFSCEDTKAQRNMPQDTQALMLSLIYPSSLQSHLKVEIVVFLQFGK